METKYISLNHRKYKLNYHIIFSTKYRRKCLLGIQSIVEDAFKYAESISDFKIKYLGIDKDHIHLLLQFKPDISIGQVIRRLKSITTNYLWRNEQEHLRYFYWKNKNILWTNGYFVETVGNVSENKISEYIKNQGK
jgi:putative transposase